ncbi:MAG: hypothetical protein FWC50_08185 [Planctomycetaceae bacterium]|nr:hypothetical protein [Planctomycetaceae bacterium]
MKRFVLISTLFAVLGLTAVVNAQEPNPALNAPASTPAANTEAAKKESTEKAKIYGPQYQLELKELTNNPAFKDLEVTKKFARRLPNFYREVINEKQKAEIYEIQASYFQVVESLKLRLEKLEAERDAQIESVLTADQKAQVESKVKAASAKRVGRRSN